MEYQEWKDDLEKIKELAAAINVRFKTVMETGEPGSERVEKATNIYSKLQDIYYQLDKMQLAILHDQAVQS
jgi:hypothetical protein